MLDATCPNCRAVFPENAKFCSSCGFAFTQELAAVNPGLRQERGAGTTVSGPVYPSIYDSTTADPLARLNEALEGRYVVERELGRGGMATVYLAKDARHEREVAIKVLLPELSASIGAERFEREIRLAAKLQHPHILGLFDSGAANGLLYYVMPFVKGESLRDRLEREQQLPVDDAILITLEVADALTHAHAQGIIHRDIKPENIMLSGGHALVADFGIARAATEAGVQKLTQTGMALGTPLYMSPEQSGGEDVGPAADVYSLACVLYEMLAGEPPFTGKTPMSIMARHALEQVPSIRIVRSAVPEEVELAIFAGMGKVPADRPRTAQEFAEIIGMPMAMTASLRAVTGPTAMRRVPSGAQLLHARALGRARRPWYTRASRITTVITLLMVLGIGGYYAVRSRGGPVDENARRVAVLYFTDESKAKDLGSLADGLTEGLINSLSNASSITVISRTGVERFRGSELPADSIARALRAGYLVRGEVDRNGKNVEVTVRLEDRSGTKIQARSFRLAEADPLAMRDSLGTAVSELIKTTLHEEIQLRAERTGTSKQAAWLELQRGEQSRKGIAALLAKGDTAAVNNAVASTDSILAHAENLDPRWAEPVTRRAWLAYQRSRSVGRDPAQIRRWVDIATQHAGRALALDPESPDALEVRGTAKYWSWLSNLETDASKKQALLLDAKADLERATQFNPKQASAFATLASLYYQVPDATTNDAYLAATKAYDADEFLTNANVVINRLFLGAYDLQLFDKADQHCKLFGSRFPQDYRSKRCRLFMFTTPRAPAFDAAAVRRLADSTVAMRAPKDTLLERLNTNLLVAAAMARAREKQPVLADSARRIVKESVGDAQIDPNRDLTYLAAFVYAQLGDEADAVRMVKEYLAANPQRARSLSDEPWWGFKNIERNAQFRQLVGARI